MNIEAAQTAIGVTFNDITLLHRALTHRSYLNENPDHPLEDNERLEFLGDAVLDFITAEYLYNRFPEMDEGHLTGIRSAVVRTETLARFAGNIQLGAYLKMGKGEEESGGRQRTAILCGAFEALLGGIYFDQGIERLKQFIIPIIKPEIKRIVDTQSYRDPKSLFQELAQGRYKITPTYKRISETGPDHAKLFTVGVYLNQTCYGKGSGPSKQQAQQAAAQNALEKIEAKVQKQR